MTRRAMELLCMSLLLCLVSQNSDGWKCLVLNESFIRTAIMAAWGGIKLSSIIILLCLVFCYNVRTIYVFC